jgi:predicted phosphoribosyltransferase
MFRATIFADRTEAGQRLAAKIQGLTLKEPIVYALPRGGVPVAAEVAAALGAPLDLILVRKIGAPGQPELAVGAVVNGDDPQIVLNEDVMAMARADMAYIESVRDRELQEIARRRQAYLGPSRPLEPAGRDVIVIDDGMATGATALAAVRALKRRGPARVILAVPVASAEAATRLGAEADLVICLEQPEYFQALGMWYADFHQLGDDEVKRLLKESAARIARAG